MNLCCFIPGKVIDEILHILRLVKDTISRNTELSIQVTFELKDLTGMASDHFKRNVKHILDKQILLNAKYSPIDQS